jgi:hypothetical protein
MKVCPQLSYSTGERPDNRLVLSRMLLEAETP